MSTDTNDIEAATSSLDPKLIDKLRTQADGALARAEANLARFESNLEAAGKAAEVAQSGIDEATVKITAAKRDLEWLDQFELIRTAHRAATSPAAKASATTTASADTADTTAANGKPVLAVVTGPTADPGDDVEPVEATAAVGTPWEDA